MEGAIASIPILLPYMEALNSNFVLGYHGCDQTIGNRLLASRHAFKPTDNDHGWLGPGIYFWEANPQRGFEGAATL